MTYVKAETTTEADRARVQLQLADIEEAGRKRGYAQAERDIVAWLRAPHDGYRLGEFADCYASAIERGEHRPKEVA